MRLYSSHLLTLDYDPSTDILFTEWPSAHPYNLNEVDKALQILVETIRNYDVKRLLIDASQTKVDPDLDEERYKEIILRFAYDLMKTRLQKSARVLTADKAREARSQEIAQEVSQKTHLSVQSQSFATRSEAQAWLLE
ncbi:hypothetical protein [Rufibacter hautae]|uniref:STAS/SEC14 domain-containing protein n=1 Tax=Rufibacter hautae TaxID=2595005 RepID=A0A5B6TF54_9BACT|nr:hypothetical protein [Rufibacter hautae]KAA3437852.1 hypothetical protein FOA19_11220 [Rufibacter hautae]